MSRSTRSPSVLCLALAALLPAQPDIARALPADTWACITCAGLDAGVTTFEAARLVGVVREILGPEGGKRLEEMAREQGGRDLAEAASVFQRAGLQPAQVRQLLAGPFAFAIGRPSLAFAMAPSCALVAHVGESAPAREAIAALERLATQQARRPLPVSTVDVAGVPFTALGLPGGVGQILHGVQDGHWFVSNSPGFLADCLGALRGQTPNLASHEALARSRGRLSGTRLAELLVDTRQFGPMLQPILPYEAAALGEALGVAGMPTLYAGFAHDGKSAQDLYELTLPGSTKGLLKAPFARPVSNRAAQWVKPNTTLFASFALDSVAAVEAGKQLLAALPAQVRREFERNFEREVGRELRRELGMTPAELLHLLGTFGPEVSIAFDLPQVAPPFLTVAGFVEVRDMERAEAAMRQLLARDTEGRIRFEDDQGVKTWSIEARVQGMRLSPAIGLRDGWLVFSNFKNVVKRHLRNGPLGGEALAADPRFAAAAKAGDGCVLFATGRLQPLLEAYWGLAATGIRTGVTQLGLDADSVPDAEDMAGAVDDIVISGHVTEEGFALRVQQPLGFGAVLPAAAAAFDWLLRYEPVAHAPRARAGKPALQRIY